MNQTMIDYIHAKIDVELEKIPHKFGEQDVRIELTVDIFPKEPEQKHIEVICHKHDWCEGDHE